MTIDPIHQLTRNRRNRPPQIRHSIGIIDIDKLKEREEDQRMRGLQNMPRQRHADLPRNLRVIVIKEEVANGKRRLRIRCKTTRATQNRWRLQTRRTDLRRHIQRGDLRPIRQALALTEGARAKRRHRCS
jgi:hypothetical protein